MRHILTLLSGVVSLAGVIPYLLATYKGTTRPNVVTWFTWTLLNIINTAAACSDGAWQTALYAGAATIGTGLIVIFGLRHGVKKYTTFDIACQVIALLGIPLWLTTAQPALAIGLLLIVDFAGGLPTLRHAWQAPHEETWQTFVASLVAGVLILISLERYDFIAIALPLYIFLFDLAIIITIFYRRRPR
jgi:hypothetical protein